MIIWIIWGDENISSRRLNGLSVLLAFMRLSSMLHIYNHYIVELMAHLHLGVWNSIKWSLWADAIAKSQRVTPLTHRSKMRSTYRTRLKVRTIRGSLLVQPPKLLKSHPNPTQVYPRVYHHWFRLFGNNFIKDLQHSIPNFQK